MTAIAVKNGVMAADTGTWQGSVIVDRSVRKIARLKDGRLFAASGEVAAAAACRAWLDGETDKPEPEAQGEFGGLILACDGVWRVDYKYRIARTCDTAVAGAHSEFLLGALYAGASAEEAVRLAIQYGDSAAGDVQVEYL